MGGGGGGGLKCESCVKACFVVFVFWHKVVTLLMKQNRIHQLEAFESRKFEVVKVRQITLELKMIYFLN